MSDDEDILVEKDELSQNQRNGVLINVAPFDGLENIGFDDNVSESDVKDEKSLQKEIRHSEESGFIVALFVVVFDIKHGMFLPL